MWSAFLLTSRQVWIIIRSVRIPLTKYGLPEVLVYPTAVVAMMAILGLIGAVFLPGWSVVLAEAVLAALLFAVLWFFRDPERHVQADENTLLAPADGRITDIETAEDNGFINAPTLRIGIFMSILDSHVNRAPCNVRVEKVTYKRGKYTNAMNPRSGRVNESNDLALVRTSSPTDRLILRQISGAIARRIVCQARQGQQLAAGQKFGMIKFGSRTELHVCTGPSSVTQHAIPNTRYQMKCLVKIGDKVKAGLTPLVRYERCPD